jgi:ABC-type antimicrobial peptide transport system permease subunit
MAGAVRAAVAAIDPDLPVADLRTMDEIAANSVVTLSFTVLTLGIAATLALILGAIGLYGVLAYAVSMRTREIGVRMALGAERATVMKMVIGQGTKLAAVGLVIGIAGAVGATRFLQGVLFGVQPLDPLTFAVTSAVFLGVAFVASWLPARRAAAVSPLESLQNE